MVPYGHLLPCTPQMFLHYQDDLAWNIVAANTLPNPELLFDAFLTGSGLPFVTADGPGMELLAMAMFALSTIDKARIADAYERWYRHVQANNPAHITPLRVGILALLGKPLRDADLAALPAARFTVTEPVAFYSLLHDYVLPWAMLASARGDLP
jgi:hypothetical protein